MTKFKTLLHGKMTKEEFNRVISALEDHERRRHDPLERPRTLDADFSDRGVSEGLMA
jgi:hypothetical protein